MFSNWLARLILVLTAFVVPEAFLNAAQPCCGQTSADGSLVGQLLIASPTIRDPHFDHAVILVVRHNQDGAMGIVINMPTGERPLTTLWKCSVRGAQTLRQRYSFLWVVLFNLNLAS
jgi:Uncharacterized ACR, COG1678